MDSLFSSRWYRVAGIHPRLRSHVRVSRHVYRGQVWYLLQDTSTGRHHRVDENTFHFIGRMDGKRSTDEIWHSLLNKLGENTPTQDETIEILCQLSDNDLLQCEITPNVAELFRRRFEKNRKRRIAMLNPLAFRVTLFDPDKLLERLAPVGRALVHPAVARRVGGRGAARIAAPRAPTGRRSGRSPRSTCSRPSSCCSCGFCIRW